MAAVHVPRHPSHPHQLSISTSSTGSTHSPFRRVHRATYPPQPTAKSSSASAAAAASTSNSSSTAVTRAHHPAHHPAPPQPPPCIDTFYGHEDTSKLCARFVSHTFNCPEILPPLPTSSSPSARSGSAAGSQPAQPNAPAIPNTLAHFVAYALHRTRLHPSVVFTALALLHRLKSRFPAARGSSGHRLFLAAYMLASKVVCDDTYSNKSWAVVGQGMFALREINQMEREMLGYLEWSLNVPGEDLAKFEREVRRIYGSSGGRDGNGRDGFGRGVEMRLTAGVGGAQAQEETAIDEPSSLTLAIPPPPPSPPHQLPTPTDVGAAAVPVPVSRPVLPPITTALPPKVGHASSYPSPPVSPRPHLPTSACSSSSTSPVDPDSDDSELEDDQYPHGSGSPSPTSSEDSATLPTPPNSAQPRVSHGYSTYGPKMGKSHSVPGFAYPSRESAGREHIVGRSSAPPVAIPVSTKRDREAIISSVTASSHHFGGAPFNAAGINGGVEEDGDAVMDLEDEKRGGVAYYTTVHPISSVTRPASTSVTVPSRASASVAARKDLREIREGGRREREGRTLKTYTVPCAW